MPSNTPEPELANFTMRDRVLQQQREPLELSQGLMRFERSLKRLKTPSGTQQRPDYQRLLDTLRRYRDREAQVTARAQATAEAAEYRRSMVMAVAGVVLCVGILLYLNLVIGVTPQVEVAQASF